MNKELKLVEYIESQMGLRFELGKNDCILFVAGAIDSMQGSKLRVKYTGLWKTPKDVYKYERSNKSVLEVLTGMGYTTIQASYIQVGDIVIIEQEGNNFRTFGVCTGSKVAIFNEKGLVLHSTNTLQIKEVLRCHKQ